MIAGRARIHQPFGGGGMTNGKPDILPQNMRTQKAQRRTIGARYPVIGDNQQWLDNAFHRFGEIGIVEQIERRLDFIGLRRRFAPSAFGHDYQGKGARQYRNERSEEHTSELQSLMRTSYAVFCLKKKKYTNSINA